MPESNKILCILTNEAFIPEHGRGGRNLLPSYDGTYQMLKKEGPIVEYASDVWRAPRPTINDPPALFQKNVENVFDSRHYRTGINIMEVASLWVKIAKRNNYELIFTSPRGGAVPIDPKSFELVEKDKELAELCQKDREFYTRLNHTYPINWIRPKDYDAVIVPGGHGAMFDLPEHPDVANVISNIYSKDGIVSTIGHGAAALINVCNPNDPGKYLIKDKKITCFSMNEEKEIGIERYLPYSLEERLRERGAKIENNRAMQSNVQVDENIVTAQNWSSINEFIDKFQKKLNNQ